MFSAESEEDQLSWLCVFVQCTKEQAFITFDYFMAQVAIKDMRVLWPYIRDLFEMPFDMLYSSLWGWQILCSSPRRVSWDN